MNPRFSIAFSGAAAVLNYQRVDGCYECSFSILVVSYLKMMYTPKIAGLIGEHDNQPIDLGAKKPFFQTHP